MFVPSSSWDDEPGKVVVQAKPIVSVNGVAVCKLRPSMGNKRKRKLDADPMPYEVSVAPKLAVVEPTVAPAALTDGKPYPRRVTKDTSRSRTAVVSSSSTRSSSLDAPMHVAVSAPQNHHVDVSSEPRPVSAPKSVSAVGLADPVISQSATLPPVDIMPNSVSEAVVKAKKAVRARATRTKQIKDLKPDQSTSAPSANYVYHDVKRNGGLKATKGAEELRRRIKRARNDRWREANGIRRGGKRAANYRRQQLSREMAHEKNLLEAVNPEAVSEMFSPGVSPAYIQSLVDELSLSHQQRLEVEQAETQGDSVSVGEKAPPPAPRAEKLVEKINFSNFLSQCEWTEDMLLQFLKSEFKHDSFREGQLEAVTGALRGNRSLVVLPTGAGKSLTFQFPSVFLRKKFKTPALTVVISPLIALMADQLKQLPPCCRGAAIHSNLSPTQTGIIYKAIEAGMIDLLFIAPERLLMYSMQEILNARGVFMVAIDEAHCLSEWSHSFRPAYLAIPKIISEELKPAALLALTATATIQTVDSLRNALTIDSLIRTDGIAIGNSTGDPTQVPSTVDTAANSIGQSVQRANLSLFARRSSNPVLDLIEFLVRPEAKTLFPIIVYTQYKYQTEQVSQVLRERGFGPAEAYNGGLSAAEREDIHDRFLNNQLRVVVATIAFGMGIDKRNVRAVIHLTVPKSIESYVQESGRCARDGLAGLCRCYFNADEYIRLRTKCAAEGLKLDAAKELVRLTSRAVIEDTVGGDETTPIQSIMPGVRQTVNGEYLIHVPEQIDSIVSKQHVSLLLSLIDSNGAAVVFQGFPRVVKLRFFHSTMKAIAETDPFVAQLFRCPHKPKADQTTVTEHSGVSTVDVLSGVAVSGLAPAQFMHQLARAAKTHRFAVAKSDWGHFVVPKPLPSGMTHDELVDRCFAAGNVNHTLELNRMDACFALMSRVAAESISDDRIGHKLIQQYFEAESRIHSGEDLFPSILQGSPPAIAKSIRDEINHIRSASSHIAN